MNADPRTRSATRGVEGERGLFDPEPVTSNNNNSRSTFTSREGGGLADRSAGPRRKHGRPHRCTACGRRTYRRRRTIPVLDERCQRCFDRGYYPKHTKETDR